MAATISGTPTPPPTGTNVHEYAPSDSGVAVSMSKRMPPLSPGSAGPWMCQATRLVVRLEKLTRRTAAVSVPLTSRVAIPEPGVRTVAFSGRSDVR
jgi:hypothetical protein